MADIHALAKRLLSAIEQQSGVCIFGVPPVGLELTQEQLRAVGVDGYVDFIKLAEAVSRDT
jgi:hypothetical protein